MEQVFDRTGLGEIMVVIMFVVVIGTSANEN
jgi:hypothetical protein